MVVLGSTGSIGVNTLSVAKRFGLHVQALVAGSNVTLLNEQIKIFHPSIVCVGDKSLVKSVNHPHVLYGNEGIIEILETTPSQLVLNALVGFLGLAPSIKTLALGKKLALANKESLVVAGALLDKKNIVPVDSEHFGLWYLQNTRKIHKMTIMASGGAFRDTPLSELASQSVADALKHPNWSMGKKITIDSATMTNKLFELLEARWLFDVTNLDALIEPRSLIHAMIEFADGCSTLQMANADMKLPIAYALLGRIDELVLPHVDLVDIGSFAFKKIESNRYPIWEIKDDLLANPQRGVVVNAANEVAIELFLAGKCNILELVALTKKAFKKFEDVNPTSLQEIFDIDAEVRKYCKNPQ
ncbi:MAG: 1-deoxy-D-xylulose-5-phosphate reductoisomerase [Sulfurospirillum sp.]|nr:1-deoxy-D-xylulose-5-phosphate reductoisomerase [Sulfurospirillum sp.]